MKMVKKFSILLLVAGSCGVQAYELARPLGEPEVGTPRHIEKYPDFYDLGRQRALARIQEDMAREAALQLAAREAAGKVGGRLDRTPIIEVNNLDLIVAKGLNAIRKEAEDAAERNAIAREQREEAANKMLEALRNKLRKPFNEKYRAKNPSHYTDDGRLKEEHRTTFEDRLDEALLLSVVRK